jgi:mono/diheme cytochrome c family protein
MKKILRWAGISLLILILLTLVSAIIILDRYNSRKEKVYTIAVPAPQIPADSTSIARGMHFVPVCQSCHSEVLEGKVFFEDPKIGKIYSPKITRGKGGVGSNYTDKDLIRAIRHGINPKGNALLIMPSTDFNAMSQHDLYDLIAYLKHTPPLDNIIGENTISFFTKVLLQLGAFGNAFHVEDINHNAPYPVAPSAAVSNEYGAYLLEITGCKACHGPELKGGKSPDPNSPYVPDIKGNGVIKTWSAEQFTITLKTGMTPENKELNDNFMPWKHTGQLPEQDLEAIYTYLMSISN